MRYLASAIAAAVLGVLAFAVPASASTGSCTQGVYTGYCGTQVSAEATPLAWDVYQQQARPGNKIIAYPDSNTDRATDFFWFAYDGGSSKIAEYAPGGVADNLCVTEPGQHAGLVLDPCTGSASQRFTATEEASGYTWTNVATGDIVTDPSGLRSQLAGISAPQTLTGADEWNFAG